ncbi:hypothetical protein SAMN05216466_103431 [Paraburkholderia phenazinium]|uniref:Uncharacterized protein n=1 Tax=Paraburkholderia phenazinium TaxID=60549 RepID=A0A1G7UEM5_9BURK|nr:hypothetical protein SAMN05216466_103431 [Paraburkholderia phenazinium]
MAFGSRAAPVVLKRARRVTASWPPVTTISRSLIKIWFTLLRPYLIFHIKLAIYFEKV